MQLSTFAIAGGVALACALGCSSSDSPASTTTDSGSNPTDSSSSDPPLTPGAQTPPQNGKDVEAWITGGAYKSWHCESAPHDARDPSPHGKNRICSNDLAASFSGSGERPRGTAAVKELYDEAGTNVVGIAVYLKTQKESAGGAAWYWYERVPTSSGAPHDAMGVVADGLGNAGPAKTICVGCHAAAGSDAMHTPTPGAGDQVYTQVK